MVLVEPSPEFWPNIKGTWQANGFPGPIAAFQCFAGAEVSGAPVNDVWPACSDSVEAGGMAYRYIGQHDDIATITIDEIARRVYPPDAITIDIEGAELLALRGATAVLCRDLPLVRVSIHSDLIGRDYGHTDTELHDFMVDLGYRGDHIHTDHEAHWKFTPEDRA